MARLTDLTIHSTFDQAKKKNKQNMEKINSRIGESKYEKRSHEWVFKIILCGNYGKLIFKQTIHPYSILC